MLLARMTLATHIPPDVLADLEPALFNALVAKLEY